MRLTVLGSAASYAGPGQACAGYLVEGASGRVLLDCGNGVLANLARVCDPATLDAVFVSHAHTDHYADLYALQALLRYAPSGPLPAMPLYLPAGLLGVLACLLSGHGAAEMGEAFVSRDLAAGEPVESGGLTVTPLAMDHADPTFAFVVESEGRRLCYTSDTAAGDAVLEAARGADLLLAEATLPQAYAGRVAHMTASEAAAVARDAGAKRLVLTHLWPTTSRQAILAEATAVYGGEVLVATELMSVEV